LIDRSHAFGEDGYTPVRILYCLGAALHGRVEEALMAQLCVMEVLFAWMPPSWGSHRRLLLPYVEQFWGDRIARQRFSFRGPSAVEAALVQAKSVPQDQRVRAILRAVRVGVRVSAPEQTSAWLNAAGPASSGA
jgi:hypothetical protein